MFVNRPGRKKEGYMSKSGEKEPLENLKEQFSSFFGLKSPQEKNEGLPPKAHFSIWYALAAILLFTYMQEYIFSSKVETIPYSQFKQYIIEGSVGKLTISPETINGTLRGDSAQKFITIRVNDPDLVKDLDDHKINYSGYYESKLLSSLLSWVIPIGIFFPKVKPTSLSTMPPASMRPKKNSRR